METSKESITDCSPPLAKKIKLEVVADCIKQEVEPDNKENDSNIENISEEKMEVESTGGSPTVSILSNKDKEMDFNEKKNVKFSESTLDFSESNTEEMKERAKLNRIKSCVVVKRIVVKSAIPTKTNL